MTEQAQEAGSLSAVIAGAATGIALALRGEGDPFALSRLIPYGDTLAPAALRVLGADVLSPYALDHRPAPAGHQDAAVVRQALAAYPPKPDASHVSLWSYRGLVEASRTLLPAGTDGWPGSPAAAAEWVARDPWPTLSHRASQLAALALPALDSELSAGLAARTDDLARGFVRAVRRRDWLQAAGIGRWLARTPQTPPSLGLDGGLAFVARMSGGDPRVLLQVAAARAFHGRGW